MNDLFGSAKAAPKATTKPLVVQEGYSAKDIEVLEGLEPVRRRPGMYIGGTDENALHHLAAEILDNSMDEAVRVHATSIEFAVQAGNWLSVRDNGRGIPVDPHPKFKTIERAGGNPHHAALRGEVRRGRVCDVRRAARGGVVRWSTR